MMLLQGQLAKMSDSQVNELRFGDFAAGTQGFRDLANATGAYRVQSVRAMSDTEAFTEALQKQKVTMTQHRKGHELRTAAMKEQYRLQRMMVMGWKEDGNGNISGDALIPRHVPQRITSLKHALSDVREGTVSWGQAIAEQRGRVGLWSQSIRSASQNVVNLGKNTQWAGRQMMVGLSLPIAAVAAGAGALAYQLDKEMTRILKVYDYSTSQIKMEQQSIKQDSLDTARAMAAAYGQAGQETLQITAALAAQGRKGADLQRTTEIVSQASFLGELDQEDALKTTTSLLTVFAEEGETAAEANERLADSFAYMNALENATTLSMKDMTQAIPRLGGVVNLLGGDVQELGVLMAATSSAGIEAAQGANALKSILFRGGAATNNTKAGKTFKDATGIEIEDITRETEGKAIPTLIKIGEAYKNSNLSAVEQLRVVKELFGIWRGGAAEMVVSQLLKINDETTNVGRAFRESKAGAESWGETARKETEALQQSISGKFKLALESVKIELAAMGEAFLPVATKILEVVGKMMSQFNGLSGTTKFILLVGAAFVAAVGPAVMLFGVILNLMGSIARYGSGLILFASRFKLVSKNQMVANLAAKQARLQFDSEAEAARRLSGVIAQLNANMVMLNKTNSQAAVSAIASEKSLRTQSVYYAGANKDIAMVVNDKGKKVRANKADVADYNDMKSKQQVIIDQQEAFEKTESGVKGVGDEADKTKRKLSGMAGGLGASLGMILALVGGTNQWVMGLGMVLMMLPAIIAGMKALAGLSAIQAVTGRIKSISVGLGPKGATGQASNLGKMIARIAPAMGPLGIAIAAAGAGFAFMEYKARQTRKEAQLLAGASEGIAKAMGVELLGKGEYVQEDGETKKGVSGIAEQFAKENAEAAKELQKLGKNIDSVVGREALENRVLKIGFDVFNATQDAQKTQH